VKKIFFCYGFIFLFLSEVVASDVDIDVTLYDSSMNTIGFIVGDFIYDSSRNEIGYLQGRSFWDRAWKKIGEIHQFNIYDSQKKLIANIIDLEKKSFFERFRWDGYWEVFGEGGDDLENTIKGVIFFFFADIKIEKGEN
jgi:hypothetical protein